jgi:hypothetical protein
MRRFRPVTAFAMVLMVVPFVLAAPAAIADATLVLKSDQGSESRMFIKDGKMRIKNDDPDEEGAALYDIPSETFISLNNRERTYTEMTAEGLKAFRAQMAAQVEAQMKDMPEDQKGMMEQMLKEMMGDVPTDLKQTGDSARVGEFACRRVDAYVNGEKVEELCLAKRGDVGLSASDYDTLMGMFRLMAKMAPEMAWWARLDGVPVQMMELEDGETDTLAQISTEALSDSLFQIPESYRRVDPFAQTQ